MALRCYSSNEPIYFLMATIEFSNLDVSIQQDSYIKLGDEVFCYVYQNNAKGFARIKNFLPEDVWLNSNNIVFCYWQRHPHLLIQLKIT